MITPVLSWLCAACQSLGLRNVFDFEPFEPDGTLSPEVYGHDGQLHLWTLLRPLAEQQRNGENYAQYHHTIVLEGRLALQGRASMVQFNTEIDTLLRFLATDDTLGGTVDTVVRLRLAESRPYSYYNQLVHYARIELLVELAS